MTIKLPPKEERLKLFGSVPPTVKTKPTTKSEMVDLQNQTNTFLFTLDEVGISNIKQPVIVNSSICPKQQTTVATFTLTSGIPSNKKGTNMSRFVEHLEEYRSRGFTVDFSNLHDFVRALAVRLNQKDARLQIEFPWFYERQGPATGLTGLNHAQAKIIINYDEEQGYKNEVSLTCGITTLCPCSKEISEYSAHNQRGYVTMNVQLSPNYNDELDWKKALLHAAESNASACIHPVLKRPDEKMVTEQAYENPRFVEDVVRLVAADLYELEWVDAFKVECKNEESIHLHDAIASLSIKKNS
ncbi:GTP cyclohydrolase FolE2 [Priestia megaterium]|uniref:GTP cyclohydrolase FolE2 n=1 Tax=Priestia megaterium TaxID=1404 RepID=UPI000471D13B|nr:GTP cyclohydrolase FolE2 [Priestia megaterium]MCM3183667.1 GTP cyclohydrolase FolE2 [Priestia megaterium]PFB06214.1 GTP cyclohydrolase I FolE2 [Priestia megaterium]